MRTTAIQSVDRWLDEADAVLAEAREAAISPSSVADPDTDCRWTVPLATLACGLADLLERLCQRPGRWILIAEDAARPHIYWQALAYEDGSLLAEATSATFGGEDERHTPAVEAALAELGWRPPSPPEHPNWLTEEATFSPDTARVAEQAVQTLGEAFGMDGADTVVLTLMASSRRGGTPASEVTDWTAEDESGSEAQAPLAPSFVPTDEPWAEWYRQRFPGWSSPATPWARYGYASTYRNTAIGLWHDRQVAIDAWVADHGADPSAWPLAHPPLILQAGGLDHAACAGCTWVDPTPWSEQDEDVCAEVAIAHAVAHGADPEVVEALGLPVTPSAARWAALLAGVDPDDPTPTVPGEWT